jgi:hypothetical protein
MEVRGKSFQESRAKFLMLSACLESHRRVMWWWYNEGWRDQVATSNTFVISLEKCQNIRTYILSSTSPRLFVCRMAFSLCPLAFFKGATMILYQHNNREQYGIGKIVATRVFALSFSLPHPHSLRQKFWRKTME